MIQPVGRGKLPGVRRIQIISESLLLQEDEFSSVFLHPCTTAGPVQGGDSWVATENKKMDVEPEDPSSHPGFAICYVFDLALASGLHDAFGFLICKMGLHSFQPNKADAGGGGGGLHDNVGKKHVTDTAR